VTPQEIAFAVCMLVGRDMTVPSQCCDVGEICRAEVRKALGLHPGVVVTQGLSSFTIPVLSDGLSGADEMWKRLHDLGLVSRDYDRILCLPSDNVLRFPDRLHRDEDAGLKGFLERVRALRDARGD
jgi:hypothetical protein